VSVAANRTGAPADVALRGCLDALLSAWLWPFFRIAAFGERGTGLWGCLRPHGCGSPWPPRSPWSWRHCGRAGRRPVVAAGGLLVAEQVLVGLLLGLGLRLALVVFDLAGQVIAQTMAWASPPWSIRPPARRSPW